MSKLILFWMQEFFRPCQKFAQSKDVVLFWFSNNNSGLFRVAAKTGLIQ